jgi:hypothetical protein
MFFLCLIEMDEFPVFMSTEPALYAILEGIDILSEEMISREHICYDCSDIFFMAEAIQNCDLISIHI